MITVQTQHSHGFHVDCALCFKMNGTLQFGLFNYMEQLQQLNNLVHVLKYFMFCIFVPCVHHELWQMSKQYWNSSWVWCSIAALTQAVTIDIHPHSYSLVCRCKEKEEEVVVDTFRYLGGQDVSPPHPVKFLGSCSTRNSHVQMMMGWCPILLED